VDQAAVAEIERQLSTKYGSVPPAAGRPRVVAAGLTEIDQSRVAYEVRIGRAGTGVGRSRGRRHLHREVDGLADRAHIGVAGQDPLHQCRTGARHTHDEDRSGCLIPFGYPVHRFSGIVRRHVRHRAHVRPHFIGERSPLHPVRLQQRGKRFLELADILQLLRQGEGGQHHIRIAQSRPRQHRAQAGDVVVVSRPSSKLRLDMQGEAAGRRQCRTCCSCTAASSISFR
jgi:hypothetical protein